MKSMNDRICRCTPDDPEILILRALYDDSVRSADAKLGGVLAALRSVESPVIVVVTADHGEHFCEHGLLEHDVGVDHALLHVPLVVHGLRGARPARISTPVQLTDLMPTILGWAGVAPPSSGLTGRPLPTTDAATGRDRAIFSEYHDYLIPVVVPSVREDLRDKMLETIKRRWKHCTDDDRISGDMQALIRYPYKYVWYEKYAPQLFDLQADPAEERDLSAAEPKVLSESAAALRQVLASVARGSQPGRAELDPAHVERLRALGYLGGEVAVGGDEASGEVGP